MNGVNQYLMKSMINQENNILSYLRLFDEGDETKEERKELLIKQKKILDEKISTMQKASKRLEYKITLYNNGELDKYLEKDENKN